VRRPALAMAAIAALAIVVATITALPIAGLVDVARYVRDATKPGGYGEAAGAGRLACASALAGGGGGGAVCMDVWVVV
jgi:hypothetical protein